MPKLIEAYGCDYCAMTSLTKSSVVRHEKKSCRGNIQRKTCRNCKHYYLDSETVYDPHHGGNPGSTDYERAVHWCEAQEKEIEDFGLNQNNNCHLFKNKA